MPVLIDLVNLVGESCVDGIIMAEEWTLRELRDIRDQSPGSY
jgi:hypothetical protein